MRLGVDATNIRAGGGVTHLVSVLSAADPRKHGFTRIAVWGSRKTLELLPSRPWIHPLGDPALEGLLPRRLLWQRYALPRIAARESDILWAVGGNSGKGFRPFVTMCRNMLPFEPAERRRYGVSWTGLRLALLARSQARTLRRADGIIFLNDYARRRVLHQVGEVAGAIETIPHGVDERFRLAPRPQRPLNSYSSSAPFRLLAVSIVDLYKHPWVVAEAVGRLRAKGIPVALDFIGSAYRPALSRLRKVLRRLDPAGSAMRYLGPVPHADLPERYHAADGFVFASSCENMPNILLEAMASGLPIACSNRGPMPELLGRDGVYFDPENPASAADAIERLALSATLRERCAADAFGRAESFRWGTCADNTMRFLAGVGRDHGTGR